MEFEKEFPSFKKYGKTHRVIWVGKTCTSEPMWSESVIQMCCLDKQKVKKIIDKWYNKLIKNGEGEPLCGRLDIEELKQKVNKK
ncbi:MAG: hypothetical protein JRI44_13340 [Deltaproteobacteria bacterium]|nr:hypothetical protein [Deltaproteobacteria bacterium]